MFLDLDHFKSVNDSYGHATGDAVLIEMARRLCGEVRVSDLVARQGGDEFTVVLTSPGTPAMALETAERMCRKLNEPYRVEDQVLHLSASVGLAVNDDLGEDPDLLMSNADLALYRAKAAGRNRVEILDATLRQTLDRRRAEEIELRHAFASGQIEAWFQPVVDIRTGGYVGAEALVRWRHPTRGVLGPASFLPLIGEFGLDDELTSTMIAQNLTMLSRLRDLGAVAPTFRSSVNMDGRLSSLAKTIEQLSGALNAGQPVAQVVLELTENAVFTEPTSLKMLGKVRDMGVSIALDDFGTGDSPLSLVRDLPLDFIKIDRRFVLGMTTHKADMAIVAAVCELARLLGVIVVAEGIEGREQEQQLADLGCILGQGFLYSPAVSPEDFLDRVVQNRAVLNRVVPNRASQNRAVQNRAVQNRAVQNRAVQNRAGH